MFVRIVLTHGVLVLQKIFHRNENGKKLFAGRSIRDGLSIDVWPEGGDVVAQPEKENLILNQNNPTTTSYTY